MDFDPTSIGATLVEDDAPGSTGTKQPQPDFDPASIGATPFYEEPIQYSEDTVNSFQPVDARYQTFQNLDPATQKLAADTINQQDTLFAGNLANPAMLQQLQQAEADRISRNRQALIGQEGYGAPPPRDGEIPIISPMGRLLRTPVSLSGQPQFTQAEQAEFEQAVPPKSLLDQPILGNPLRIPYVTPPNPTGAMGFESQVLDKLSGFTSPKMAALAAALPGVNEAAPALGKAISAYFGVDMGRAAISDIQNKNYGGAAVDILGAVGAVGHVLERQAPIQVDPDLGIVKTPAGPVKVENGSVQPLTPVETQSAAALKGPEAVAPTVTEPVTEQNGSQLGTPIPTDTTPNPSPIEASPLKVIDEHGLIPMHPDDFEREAGAPVQEGSTPYRDPSTNQPVQIPDNSTPGHTKDIIDASRREEEMARNRGQHEDEADQSVQDLRLRIQQERADWVNNTASEAYKAALTRDQLRDQFPADPDRIQAYRDKIISDHRKALAGTLRDENGNIEPPKPQAEVDANVASANVALQRAKDLYTEPKKYGIVSGQETEEEPPNSKTLAPNALYEDPDRLQVLHDDLQSRGLATDAQLEPLRSRIRQLRGEPETPAAPPTETPTAPSQKSPLETFADKVNELAKTAPEDDRFSGSSKVYIDRIWNRLPEGLVSSREDFNRKLFQAHQKGLIRLSRLDLVGAEPRRDLIDRSEIKDSIGEYHLVNEPEDRAPDRTENIKEAPKSEPEPDRLTSIKNAVTDQEREARGLPPADPVVRRAFPQVRQDALDELSKRTNAGDDLVQELKAKPRAITDTEDALLLKRQIDVQNENDRAVKDAVAAKTESEKFDAQARIQRTRDQLQDIYTADRNAGTETARGLNARKMAANQNFELGRMLAETEAAKGSPLTAAEKDSVQDKSNAIKKAEAAETKAAADAETKKAEAAADEQIKSDKKEAAAEKPARKSRAAKAAPAPGKVRTFLNESREAALQRIKERSKKLYSNPLSPIAHLTDETIIAASHIANGLADFGAWSKEMVKDLGEAIRPHLTALFEKGKRFVEAQENIVSISERMAARAKEGEGIDTLAPYVKRIGKELVRSGIEHRDPLVNALHDRVKDILPGITKDRVRDAYSGYGDFRPLSKDEIEVKNRDLKGQLQQIAKLESMQRGEAPAKTGPERRTPSDEERRLQQQVEQAKKIGGYRVTDPETQLRTALQAHERQLSNQIKDVATEIETGQRKTSNPASTNDRIEGLKDILNRLRETRDAIFGKKGLTDQQRLDAAVKAADRMTKEYERQVEKEDFLRSKGKPALTSPELDAAKARRDAARAQRDEYRALDEDFQKQSAEDNQRRALASAKTRTLNQIADLKDKIAKGDFSKGPKRAPITPDAELTKSQAQLADLKRQFQEGNLKLEAKNRSIPQKILDASAKWTNTVMLANPVILAKLAAASVYRYGSIVAETPAQLAIHLFARKLSERAPYEGGFIRPMEEVRSVIQGVIQGVKDIPRIMATHSDTLDAAYGPNRPQIQNKFVDWVGATHAAVKSPIKRVIWERSFARRMESYAKQGLDVKDPAVQMRAGTEALMDANRAIFMNDNRLSQGMNMLIRHLERDQPVESGPAKGQAKTLTGGKIAAYAIKQAFPIAKVATNVAIEGLNYGLGLLGGGYKLTEAFRNGIEDLSPAQADQIVRMLKKGSVGASIMLAAWYNQKQVGGYYIEHLPQKPDEPKPGDVKVGQTPISPAFTVPKSLLHTPMMDAANYAATTRKAYDYMISKGHNPSLSLAAGIGASALGFAKGIPYIGNTLDFEKLGSLTGIGKYASNVVNSRVIPGVSSYAAKVQDTPNKTLSTIVNPQPVKRDPQDVLQSFEQDIPFLRQNVGVKPSSKPTKSNYTRTSYKTGYTSKKN